MVPEAEAAANRGEPGARVLPERQQEGLASVEAVLHQLLGVFGLVGLVTAIGCVHLLDQRHVEVETVHPEGELADEEENHIHVASNLGEHRIE